MIIMSERYSPVPVFESTKKRLKAYGIKDETYDQLVNRLLDELNHKREEKE